MPGEPMTNQSLGDALPLEMKRVRDKVLPVYLQIPTGIFAASLMREALDQAEKAMAEGGGVAMIKAYQELKGFEL